MIKLKEFEAADWQELVALENDIGAVKKSNKSRILSRIKNVMRTHGFEIVIGKSEMMKNILKFVDKVADTDSTILITGESGTGKELIARMIHYCSQRSNGTFVSINCAVIPERLLERELFGYIKGASTTINDMKGLFQAANGGTFFLGEIGELSLPIQNKLLSVLQKQEIIPVGGSSPIKVDMRFIASTELDLANKVKLGSFGIDLYNQVSEVQIILPALRERRADIPFYIDHFLEKAYQKSGEIKSVPEEVMELLMNYDWPGNVQELENSIERALLMSGESNVLTIEQFYQLKKENATLGQLEERESLKAKLIAVEKQIILETLKKTDWEITKAAELLEVSRQHLHEKIKHYNIS